eukprot:1145233-Pelagomonas_calceolata.AAC.1
MRHTLSLTRHGAPFHAKLYPEIGYPAQLNATTFSTLACLKRLEKDTSLHPERIQETSPPPVHVESGQAYFIVDYIMGHEPTTAKSHEETKKYLIKWEGYPLWEATKEPAKNIYKGVPQVQQSPAPTAQQFLSSSLHTQDNRRGEEPQRQQDYQRPLRTRKQPAKFKDSAWLAAADNFLPNFKGRENAPQRLQLEDDSVSSVCPLRTSKGDVKDKLGARAALTNSTVSSACPPVAPSPSWIRTWPK